MGGVVLLIIAALGAECAGSDKNAAAPPKADHIIIVKSTRIMTLVREGMVLKIYKVALGGQPVGKKDREGDHKTPEGDYLIDMKNSESRFHLSLHISYPDTSDRENARKLHLHPGGSIMIHGLPAMFGWVGALHRQMDWTDGCVAVTNLEIEEIWKMVDVGTPVKILP